MYDIILLGLHEFYSLDYVTWCHNEYWHLINILQLCTQVAQPINKFSASYVIRWFLTVLTRVCRLSSASLTRSIFSPLLISILIFFLPSTHRSPKSIPTFIFSHHNFVCISYPSHVCYMPRQSLPPLFGHLSNIGKSSLVKECSGKLLLLWFIILAPRTQGLFTNYAIAKSWKKWPRTYCLLLRLSIHVVEERFLFTLCVWRVLEQFVCLCSYVGRFSYLFRVNTFHALLRYGRHNHNESVIKNIWRKIFLCFLTLVLIIIFYLLWKGFATHNTAEAIHLVKTCMAFFSRVIECSCLCSLVVKSPFV